MDSGAGAGVRQHTSGFAGEHGVEERLYLATADVVSLHVPLTAETRGMVNAQWLAEFTNRFSC